MFYRPDLCPGEDSITRKAEEIAKMKFGVNRLRRFISESKKLGECPEKAMARGLAGALRKICDRHGRQVADSSSIQFVDALNQAKNQD